MNKNSLFAATLLVNLAAPLGASAQTDVVRRQAPPDNEEAGIVGLSTRPDLALERPAPPPTPSEWLGAAPVKISGPLVSGGDVVSFLFSPDGMTVVYQADQQTNGFNELYSVPSAGGVQTKLNPTVVSGSGTFSYRIMFDGTAVVYTYSSSSLIAQQIYIVPIGGGVSTKLNPDPVDGGNVSTGAFALTQDRVIYIADLDVDNDFKLYSTPLAGGATTQLNGPLVAQGDVISFALTQDGGRVVYLADQQAENVNELYSVPVTGGTAVKLNLPLVAGGNVVSWVSDGGRTVCGADQNIDGVFELYSVPSSGGTPVKLNGTLTPGGSVTFFFVGPAMTAYRADQDTDGVFEGYAVPTAGGTAIKLNPSLVVGGNVVGGPRLNFANSLLTYAADQETDNVTELYSVPATGGPATKLSGPMVAGGDELGDAIIQIGLGTVGPDRVIYLADQGTDEVVEIYGVPLTGGTPVKLNGPLVAGGDVLGATITSSGMAFYDADQNADTVNELYAVSLTGLGPVTKLNGPLVAGGDVTARNFSVGRGLSGRVVYMADQDADTVVELYSLLLDTDADGDAVIDGVDCVVFDDTSWALPGEATDLLLSHAGGVGGTTTLSWTVPVDLGGTEVIYDLVRSSQPDGFDTGSATCLETDDGSDTTAVDTDTPASGQVFHYVVRAQNTCGPGSSGLDSVGDARSVRSCP